VLHNTIASPADLEEMWSARQLAEHYDIPVQTVQKAAQKGDIPGCIRVLGTYRFDVEKAKTWVPRRLNASVDPANVRKGYSGFKKANTLGGTSNTQGRPSRRVEEKYLKGLTTKVGIEEWGQIVDKAIEQAIAGDWRARNWISNYLMGTPAKRIIADIDIKTHQTLEMGERAAAVQALLKTISNRIIDGTATSEST